MFLLSIAHRILTIFQRNKMETENLTVRTYSTSDIYLSAFLQEEGFRIITTKEQNRRVTLVFEDPEDRARDAVCRYFNGDSVSGVRFADRLRHLKTLVIRGWNG